MKSLKLSYIAKTIILKLLSLILLLKKRMKWFLQYKRLSKYYIKASEFKFNQNDKILIIVPHADDELIGAYELIKKYKRNIELFYCAYTGSNSSRENYEIRLSEFIHLCEHVDVRYTISSNDVRTSLNTRLLEYNPGYVFIPSFIDWHNEHTKISELMLNRVGASYDIVLYQISVPIHNEMISHYIPMTKREHGEKWKTFYCIYKSQRSIPFIRFKYNEMINRINDETYASEVFTLLKYSEWEKLFIGFRQKSESIEFNRLKLSINDLNDVRNQAKQIYKLIETRDEECHCMKKS